MMATTTGELSAKSLGLLFSDLGSVYHAGLALPSGIDILRANARSAGAKEYLAALYEEVSSGSSLYDAMKAVGRMPAYALSLVHIGETTGRMEETLHGLTRYYNNREVLAQSVRNALVYPLFMFIIVAIVSVLLLTQAMPVFDRAFNDLGLQMTGVAAAMLAAGSGLSSAALWIVGVVILVIIIILIMRMMPVGRRVFSYLFQTLPVLRAVSFKISSQRIALVLSTMLEAGLDIDQALDFALPLVDDRRAKAKLAALKEDMDKGTDFTKALEASNLFEYEAMSHLAIGLATGTSASAFDDVSEQVLQQTEDRIERLVGAIEPILVGIMCVLIGIILLAVMLPLLSVMTSF
jgi:type IV pilus assembly protein PilC